MFADANELMRAIQSTGFAVLELELYLDSHQDDQDALYDYAQLEKRLKALKNAYEQQVGPLSGFGTERTNERQGWVEQPWPWEF